MRFRWPLSHSLLTEVFHPFSWLVEFPLHGMLSDGRAPSSRGLGHWPFTPVTRVRIPSGSFVQTANRFGRNQF